MKSKKTILIFMLVLAVTSVPLFQVEYTSNPNERIANFNSYPLTSQIQAEFYVSPSGNDSNDGSFALPFKTITKAQEIVRNNISGGMTGDVNVYLQNGTYQITETLNFNQSDNGRDGHSVIYKAHPGHAPVVDGGYKIDPSSWIPHDGQIWKCKPGVGEFRQLYVVTKEGKNHNTPKPNAGTIDDAPYAGRPTSLSVQTSTYDGSGNWERRAIRAREKVPEDTFTLESDGHGYKVSNGFWSNLSEWKTPSSNTISEQLHYAKDLEFVYHMLWCLRRIPVYLVDEYEGQNRIVMQQPAFHFARHQGYGVNLGDWPDITQPDWIENAYGLLNEPGEWYYDRFTGWLYYWPLDCEAPPNSTNIEFTVPRVQTLVEMNGSKTSPVENIFFEGITFKHATWLRPSHHPAGFIDWQANVIYNYDDDFDGKTDERSPAAVVVSYANNITFERCVFTKLGSAGLDLYIGCQNSTVRGCTFDDISGTGINVGNYKPIYNNSDPEVPRNNSIINNYITNIAVEFKGGHAIWTGYTNSCRIEHNEISGTAYSALGLGWGWSAAKTICGNNSIQYNHITNYMMELQDGGAIYMLSQQNGTRVQYNRIHDGGGSGLYPDQGTYLTTWRYNVAYRSGNSLQDHSGWWDTFIYDNVIENNYFDMLPIIEPDRQKPHIPNNLWDIGNDPNASVLAIVAGAGLEPSYADLLTGNETIRRYPGGGLYWSDLPEDMENALDPATFWIFAGGIIAVAVIGVYTIGIRKNEVKRMVDEGGNGT